uniref:Uncharacterized protein n=1 Tax=Arundo donax TaxID=35708 RepID=A0A0A9AKX6_ARUDO
MCICVYDTSGISVNSQICHGLNIW